MQANRSGHAKAVLNEVQTRHDDIKKIEKTILVSTSQKNACDDALLKGWIIGITSTVSRYADDD